MSFNEKIIVAAHKPFKLDLDSCYVPVQAGAFGKESLKGMVRDDQNEHISQKNPYYSELTALYYAWKNMDYSHLGLMHYRRLLKGNYSTTSKILSQKQIESLLEKTDCIVPRKRHYVIETIESHYSHTHYGEDLEKTRKVIARLYPEYLQAWDSQMKRRSAHMFNMFIMKKDLLDGYLTFLFSILFELEKEIRPERYDAYQARVLGRISELLLDVYLETNHIRYKEVALWSPEPVNWLKKGTAFIKAKFFNDKYKGSF